jgi:RNA polymerase sigma-70 factor (ECF subfamily)
MCFLYLCDKTLAEDAMQETFLKVYRALDSFRGDSNEKTWIMKIAIRTCYDMNHSGWFRMFNRHVTPDMVPEAAGPFEESDDELMSAVTQLPIRLREVILLYYYQRMKVNEVAEALGISQSSVSGRLKRGREKLKAMMEGSEFDE